MLKRFFTLHLTQLSSSIQNYTFIVWHYNKSNFKCYCCNGDCYNILFMCKVNNVNGTMLTMRIVNYADIMFAIYSKSNGKKEKYYLHSTYCVDFVSCLPIDNNNCLYTKLIYCFCLNIMNNCGKTIFIEK